MGPGGFVMKWPAELVVVRHGQSAYNDLKERKKIDPLYKEFLRSYETAWDSPETRELALKVKQRFALNVSDYDTPITELGTRQAEETGRRLQGLIALPDIVHVSPSLRTRETFESMKRTWPGLAGTEVVSEERIREKGHGLALLYNDFRLFHVFHPHEKLLRDLEGEYFYRFPNGECTPDVRERIRSWLGTLIREFAGMRVLAITHHLTILSLRANLERLSPEEFLRLDEKEKPINCGVTKYRGDPTQGKDGRLVLDFYNKKLY